MIPVQHIAASQMFFLLEGMNDAARREGVAPIHSQEFYKRIASSRQGGITDYVENLNIVIDTLTACVLVALENEAMDFPGVFEYEVTACIGDILYTDNYHKPEKLSEDYREICSLIRARAYEFFQQEKTNKRVSAAKFKHMVTSIESALADGTYQFKAGVSR